MNGDPRIRRLNEEAIRDGKFVLYWMQQSQRVHYNHALLRASYWALNLDLPLVVFFAIKEDYPEANIRHFRFMLEGLLQVSEDLKQLGIQFVMKKTDPTAGALEISREASMTVCDMGYLKHQRRWRDDLSRSMRCPLEMVETDVVVPVEEAYPKEAYSAAVLRPRIRKHLPEHLVVPRELWPERDSLDLDFDSLNISDPGRILNGMNIDRSVEPVSDCRGGGGEANIRLQRFITGKLKKYPENRNDPSLSIQSDLSPYLHFGQISPLFIAMEIMNKGDEGVDDFLEELIVRRELAMNYCHYNSGYDSFDGLPGWAVASLEDHSSNRRDHIYSIEALEHAQTHDPYWNAAQKEMVKTGKMHNYMRMYWGKKIIEWSEHPREAFDVAIYLNNKYNLDGRDPNSYAGVAWCFGKHDRPWKERPVFGKVRYMNARGLERKFDMESYLKRNGG
jgi:deoxyribodipyrimidine photo-lyase